MALSCRRRSTSAGEGRAYCCYGCLEQRSWEQDGAKRSKVELIADEIAVAVKSIESFDRKRAGEKGAGGQKPVAAKQAQRPRTQAPSQTVMEDAEPF